MDRMTAKERQLQDCTEMQSVYFEDNRFGYVVRVACISCAPEEAVEQSRVMTDAIAREIQSQLDHICERYNIYLLIFSEGITPEQRMEVENNKYCCRKIVLKQVMPRSDDALKEAVENRLFRVDTQAALSEREQPLSSILEAWNPALLDFIQSGTDSMNEQAVAEAVRLLTKEKADV